MALEVKEVKAGPRRPAGGYQHTVKTKAGGSGELAGERVTALPLKPGPTPRQWDGKRVTPKPKPTTDPAIDLQSRTIKQKT